MDIENSSIACRWYSCGKINFRLSRYMNENRNYIRVACSTYVTFGNWNAFKSDRQNSRHPRYSETCLRGFLSFFGQYFTGNILAFVANTWKAISVINVIFCSERPRKWLIDSRRAAYWYIRRDACWYTI